MTRPLLHKRFAQLLTLLLITGILSGAPSASAVGADPADFDANGVHDLPVGVTGENEGTGLAQVFYSLGEDGLVGGSGVVDESITQNTPGADGGSEIDDGFAAALAVGDFDGDGISDLAVGVPGENDGAGLVQVFYSFGTSGLVAGADGVNDESITQDAPGVSGAAEAGDRFGATVTVGDFDGDGVDDLAVGSPGENNLSGAVHVFFSIGTEGLLDPVTGAQDEAFTQNSANVNGVGEPGDLFGAAMAVGDFDDDGIDDLAVGVPGEDGGSGLVQVFFSQGGAGLITAADGARDESVHQAIPNANGHPESRDAFGASLAAGDFNDDGVDDLAIGVPGEDDRAGMVQVFYSQGPVGLVSAIDGVNDMSASQDSPSANGSSEAGDLFGAALAVGDFNGDGIHDLAVGVPGENDRSGIAQVLYSHGATGLANGNGAIADESFTQNSTNADGTSEPGDLLASALAVGDFDDDGLDDLAVGVPGENDDSGLVQVFYSFGQEGFVSATAGVDDESVTQDSPNGNGFGEAGDLFGAALPLSPCVIDTCRVNPVVPPPSCSGMDATIAGTAGDDSLVGSRRADVIVGRQGDDTIDGDRGDDVLCGGSGSDVAAGGRGDDVVEGNAGADVLDGDAGDDHIEGGSGADEMSGGPGADVMHGGTSGDSMGGGNHNDTMLGESGSDRMLGHGGADTLDGGSGNDILDGGPGPDQLAGGVGGDRIRGASGGDVLDGGIGNDKLFGGAGPDTFVFIVGDGVDIVFDWETGIDRIDLSGHALLNSWADVIALARQVGDNVVIGDPTDQDKIVLLDTAVSELSEGSFVL